MSVRKSELAVSDSYFLKVETGGSGHSSSRSPSPNTPIKGLSLFRMISRKIGKNARKSKEMTSSDEEEDSNSFSNSFSRSKKDTDGCDCDYFYKNEQNILMLRNRSNSFTDESLKRERSKEYRARNERCLRFSTPCNGYHPSSGSDTCSSNDDSSGGNNFSSNDSSTSSSSGSYRNSRAIVRKVLKSLNLNSRSLSCSSISQMKEIPTGERNNVKEKRTKKSPQKILRQPVTYTYVRGISGLPTHRVVNTRGCYNNQYSRG